MSTTTYEIHTQEKDGKSTTTLRLHGSVSTKNAILEEDLGGGIGDFITIPLADLARLGRVAQAILDGREPAARNYDTKEIHSA